MKVIYNQDQLERLAILGAKVQVYPNGITKLDLEGVEMKDIKKVYQLLLLNLLFLYLLQPKEDHYKTFYIYYLRESMYGFLLKYLDNL